VIYCRECGTEAPESASYCGECGESLGGNDTTADDDQEHDTPQSSETHPENESRQNATESQTESVTDRLEPKLRRLLWPDSWSHRLLGAGLAVIPALWAYLAIVIGLYVTDIGWLFWALIPTFTYLIIQGESWKEMTGVALFWLSIESLVTPVALLGYTVVYAGEETTGLATAGAGLGGLVLVVVAFVVGVPLSGVFYLLSRRLS